MKVYVASDHRGFSLKGVLLSYIEELGYTCFDVGTYSPEPIDYPDVAKKLAEKVLSNSEYKGIGICGTGIGISIALNRYRGIRAALCHDVNTAKMSREHVDANVLVIGSDVIKSRNLAAEIIKTFLETEFSNEERHKRRIKELDSI